MLATCQACSLQLAAPARSRVAARSLKLGPLPWPGGMGSQFIEPYTLTNRALDQPTRGPGASTDP